MTDRLEYTLEDLIAVCLPSRPSLEMPVVNSVVKDSQDKREFIHLVWSEGSFGVLPSLYLENFKGISGR